MLSSLRVKSPIKIKFSVSFNELSKAFGSSVKLPDKVSVK